MTKALWFVAPGRVELREEVLPAPAPGELRVRGRYSAISWGTERHLWLGTGPTPFDPSLDPPGASTYPRRYGYAWVGEVTEGRELLPGTRVFSLASHAEEHVLPRDRVRPLPDAVPLLRATLAPSLETALNSVWDAEVSLGEQVLVLGGGTIGTLCAWLARRAGAGSVRVVEPNRARHAALAELGIPEVATPGEVERASTDGFDVVIEASGDPATLDLAIASTRTEGRIVVTSFYGERRAAIGLGSRFHRARLSLISSQVSRLPPRLAARFDRDRRFEVVLDLLREPRLDALIAPVVPFARASATYQRMSEGGVDAQMVFAY